MKKVWIAWVVAAVILFGGLVSVERADAAGELSETKEGLTATLRLTPEKSMVDLFLKDAGTGKAVKDAEADAVIKMPDGSTVSKELMGMNMGGEFSYMNSLVMRQKGTYEFVVNVKARGKAHRFEFTQRVD